MVCFIVLCRNDHTLDARRTCRPLLQQTRPAAAPQGSPTQQQSSTSQRLWTQRTRQRGCPGHADRQMMSAACMGTAIAHMQGEVLGTTGFHRRCISALMTRMSALSPLPSGRGRQEGTDSRCRRAGTSLTQAVRASHVVPTQVHWSAGM